MYVRATYTGHLENTTPSPFCPSKLKVRTLEMLRGEFEPTPSPRRSSVCSAALACGARVLCACACWIRVCVCVCCVRAAGVCCVLYSAARPVCAALRRRLGWQGCAVGCGVLRVVARLPDGVRRPRSPPDRVVGGPGREHAVGAACEAAARLARMFPCGEGRAYVFTLRARAGAGGGVVSPRSDVGWSSACRGRGARCLAAIALRAL